MPDRSRSHCFHGCFRGRKRYTESMEEYEIRIITEQDLHLQSLIDTGRRFALAVPAGTDALVYASASSIRLLPASARALLDPVEAIGFLTWIHFAGRHYGLIICLCPVDMASVVAGLLGRLPGLSRVLTIETDHLTREAIRLADGLWPLVGTQYTTLEEGRLLIAELRQKCPWDHQQTHVSLLDTLLEESYEVALAIQRDSAHNLEEELGDLLLQVFIQSEVAREEDGFDICDVVRTADDKLTFRHPHVFGSMSVTSSDQVLENWQKLKTLEGRKTVSYTHLRAHETRHDLVCRLLLEKKKKKKKKKKIHKNKEKQKKKKQKNIQKK